MLTRFEHFAVTTMTGAADTPPRANGALCFGQEWERTAFGVALALARDGHFEWEDFRSQLIASIEGWEQGHALDDPSWNYYEQWLAALEQAVIEAGLASRAEIDARLGGASA
ncbi:nitrile hydratase accessory protein [Aquabacter sp. CN5-332]|uniref:nitrile hydratase accessory protein n=1 Tax=Aquabacter sp. CN5-332 TaxID=3156608 RepID=UPI0032B38C0F